MSSYQDNPLAGLGDQIYDMTFEETSKLAARLRRDEWTRLRMKVAEARLDEFLG